MADDELNEYDEEERNLLEDAAEKSAEKGGEAPIWWIKWSWMPGQCFYMKEELDSFDKAFDHLWTTTLEQYSTKGRRPMTKSQAREYLVASWANVIIAPDENQYSIDFYFKSDPGEVY